MPSDEERRQAAERLLRAREDAARQKAGADDAQEAQDEDDLLRARFPDPENDERLRVPTGSALPSPPQMEISRPAPPEESNQETNRVGLGALRGAEFGEGDLRSLGEASTIGWTLALSVVIGAGLGYLVDRFVLHSGATPWGLIVGFLLGTASGFVNLVRVTNRLNARDEKRERERKK
jgi:F0F1-type ATP synthase assembly protein I